MVVVVGDVGVVCGVLVGGATPPEPELLAGGVTVELELLLEELELDCDGPLAVVVGGLPPPCAGTVNAGGTLVSVAAEPPPPQPARANAAVASSPPRAAARGRGRRRRDELATATLGAERRHPAAAVGAVVEVLLGQLVAVVAEPEVVD